MNDPSGNPAPSAIDLSNVPEPMRSLLLKQLAKMPPRMREKLMREGSPIIDRMIANARGHAGQKVASLPASAAQSAAIDEDRLKPLGPNRGNYNTSSPGRIPTVSPGDTDSSGAWVLAAAIALVVSVWYALKG